MRPLGLIPFWWGPVTAVVATVTLAIAGVTGGGGLLWTVLIGVAAVFLVVHSFVSRMLEQSIIRRLGRDYDKVQQRVVRVVADLGDLTGMYDLWMIDLYLPANRYRLTMRFPFIVRTEVLDRQLSVSLVDARPQPPSVDSMMGPHGEAYRSGAPVLWMFPKRGPMVTTASSNTRRTRTSGSNPLMGSCTSSRSLTNLGRAA